MARADRHIFADPGIAPVPVAPRGHRRRAVGAELLSRGLVSSDDIIKALSGPRRQAGRLADTLRARGLIQENELLEVTARSWGIKTIDLASTLPDPRLISTLGPMTCLQYGFTPLRRAGDVTVIALSRPEEFATIRPMVESTFGPIATALALERDVIAAIHACHGLDLARLAENRVPAPESCRGWAKLHHAPRAMAVLVAAGLTTAWVPVAVGLLLLGLSLLSLILIVGLKLLAMRAAFHSPLRPGPCAVEDDTLPCIDSAK